MITVDTTSKMQYSEKYTSLFVKMASFTNYKMDVYLLDEDENKYNYAADGIPSGYSLRKITRGAKGFS